MKVIVMSVVVVRRQHEVKQTGTSKLALHDLEDRAALRERPPDAVDVVAGPRLAPLVDAQRAERAGPERLDLDREAEAVLARPVRPAHVAARICRRERGLLDAALAQVAPGLVERDR